MGSLFVMWACDAFGRKASIQFGSVLAVIGGALQGGAAALEYVPLELLMLRPSHLTRVQDVPNWPVHIRNRDWYPRHRLPYVLI